MSELKQIESEQELKVSPMPAELPKIDETTADSTKPATRELQPSSLKDWCKGKYTNQDQDIKRTFRLILGVGEVCAGVLLGSVLLMLWATWQYFADPASVEFAFSWDRVNARGPMWFLVLPQIGVFFSALIAGYVWSRTWIQKQQANRIQEDARLVQEKTLAHQEKVLREQQIQNSASQTQFEARLIADQNQAQRRILEERFNRILDDFASKDPASRAGAASRFVSIAKELNPEAEKGAPLNEENNPFYMPAARQLSQRLAMETDTRVGKAIQDALSELSEWTGKCVEEAVPGARKNAEETQSRLVNLLADINRAAYGDWLEALAKVIRSRVAFEELQQPEHEESKFEDALFDTLSGEEFKALPPGTNWSGDTDIDIPALRVHFAKPRFSETYINATSLKPVENLASYLLANQQLRFARDVLADSLRALREPNDNPRKDIRWMRNPPLHLNGVFLQGATLYHTNLQGAKFDSANLQGANLFGADLQRTSLTEANLQGVILEGANLEGAFLYGANLQGAKLHDADLTAAKELPITALDAEYREPVWDKKSKMLVIPNGELNKRQQAQYDVVKHKLIKQRTIPPGFVGPHDKPMEPSPSTEQEPTA